jgi:hypothetical protein
MDDALTQTTDTTPAALAAALAAGDRPAAEAIVQAMGRSVPAGALPDAAAVHMLAGRWSEAARLLNRIIDPDDTVRSRRLLARNMVAAAKHRPDLAATLADCDPFDLAPFRAGFTPAGQPTIFDDAAGICLSTTHDPAAATAQTLKQLAKPLADGSALGLLGLGDGHLLAALAAHDNDLPLGRKQPVHVFIDDPRHLLAAFAVHDYASAAGPLAQERFFLHVGPDCVESFARLVDADPTIAPPAVKITQGPQGARIEPRLAALSDALARRTAELQQRVAAHAASMSAVHLSRRLEACGLRLEAPDPAPQAPGPKPQASPPARAMFITSRFTTVLQHSVRDTAHALDALGFDTHLLIEPADHHQITALSILDAIDRFKPDLVFVIDHLRREYGPLFPPGLPFICWIQDHLPNLVTREAAASIGPRDFVLTSVGPMYRNFGYPDRQLIPTPKLTRIPDRPAAWQSTGDDLVYVSNAAQDPDALIADVLATAGENPLMRKLLDHACRSLRDLYARGQSVSTLYELGRLIDDAMAATGVAVTDPAVRSNLIYLLNHPLNNALYRQQALRWVDAAAAELGLTLALYGAGWERHRDFAPFARGPIAYGPALEQLTRDSKINLQIVPSYCLHQRMLDGLAAGGFFLVRSHPSDTLMPALAAMLHEHAPEARSIDEARRAIPAERLADFEQLLEQATCFTELGMPIDLVGWIAACRESRLLDDAGVALPHLADVSFHDEATFRTAAARFIADDDLRRAVAAAQRASVEGRLSYTAGMQRVMVRIAALIREEKTA